MPPHRGVQYSYSLTYLLPQGFPDSVAPQYSSYMFWRGVQYLFGGGWKGGGRAYSAVVNGC